MDSRAKQRLTGAVILVALFVLLVPELLTGPRNAGGDAPSEEGMRRYTIDLDAPAGGSTPATPAQPAPAVALPPVAETSGRDDRGETRAVPGEAAQTPAAANAPSSASSTAAPAVATPMAAPPQTVATNPVPTAPTATAPKPAATPQPARTDSPRAETPRPAPAAAATPRGGFAVQLGSFVSKENAERLVKEMNAKGFNAFVAPPIMTGGRELYRVRVGPTRDRAAAEALAAQLRRIGQTGSIVSIS